MTPRFRATRSSRLANQVFFSVLGLVLLSCRHSQDGQSQGKAAQVTRAVEMLRLSSKHDKTLWLKRLRALPCGSADICELQQTCVGAYDEYLNAIESIELVRHNLEPPDEDAAPDASAEVVLKAAALAQNAQRKLRKSRQTTQECAENETVIRQRYKIR